MIGSKKSEWLLSKPKLERNSSLRKWQWVYQEQQAAFLTGKYKKWMGNKNQSKKHWKKPGNPMIKQKYNIN